MRAVFSVNGTARYYRQLSAGEGPAAVKKMLLGWVKVAHYPGGREIANLRGPSVTAYWLEG